MATWEASIIKWKCGVKLWMGKGKAIMEAMAFLIYWKSCEVSRVQDKVGDLNGQA